MAATRKLICALHVEDATFRKWLRWEQLLRKGDAVNLGDFGRFEVEEIQESGRCGPNGDEIDQVVWLRREFNFTLFETP